MSVADRFARLPTAAKLLLILTLAILPIGIALTLIGDTGIRQANSALQGRTEDQERTAAGAIESLIARNALALRVTANGALADGAGGNPCDRMRNSLAIAPAVSQSFELESGDGRPICSSGTMADTGSLPLVAPGDIRLRVAPDADAIAIRAGVIGGMATALVGVDEIRTAARETGADIKRLVIHDSQRELRVIGAQDASPQLDYADFPIGNGALAVRVGFARARITPLDRLVLLLPVLMWVAAALITWLLVSRLLIRPLRHLQRAVIRYQPGKTGLSLPRKLGPSREIAELGDAFSRAATRVDESEREMADALEGQRRLVREVHHRVKNNLQVVASLLNIHGRSAETADGRAAYASISRRVGALSIVHRNHFAEMEESRGIALRPLISELAAELRATAPEPARGVVVDLNLESVHTTQDVAVAVAFLVTEIVECAMLQRPKDPIDISLRRTSELTARLTLGSAILVPEDADNSDKAQFERIVAGLAKQLRSTLDRKLGQYSVDLPVFPQE
jgi:two-component sensor histidine kinase